MVKMKRALAYMYLSERGSDCDMRNSGINVELYLTLPLFFPKGNMNAKVTIYINAAHSRLE